MDEFIIGVYRTMAAAHRCSAEDILEDPDLRVPFLTRIREGVGRDVPERQALHRLSYLRKQRRLPRRRDLMAV